MTVTFLSSALSVQPEDGRTYVILFTKPDRHLVLNAELEDALAGEHTGGEAEIIAALQQKGVSFSKIF